MPKSRAKNQPGKLEFPATSPTKANDIQIGGEHYKKNEIQPWDFIIQNRYTYMQGTAMVYLSRCYDKGNPIENLEKTKHYLDKMIEEIKLGRKP